MLKIPKENPKVKLWGNGEIEVSYGLGSKRSISWYAKKLSKTFPLSEKVKKKLQKDAIIR